MDGIDFTTALAVDTEGTGVDIRHGAAPYLVAISPGSSADYWEWEVDPLTRNVWAPRKDKQEVDDIINSGIPLILQNPKYDATSLVRAGVISHWPWENTWDTLTAAHLLASNKPKDLTSLALEYCHMDIQTLEEDLEVAVKECQRIVKREKLGWRIARKGLDEMPSAGEKIWKFDTWLPRAMAKHQNLMETHPWWDVASGYATADPVATFQVMRVQEKLIKERGLWNIYLARLKVIPVIYEMEAAGVTFSTSRLNQLYKQFEQRATTKAQVCVSIARSYGYDLELPKGTSNNSLKNFVFGTKRQWRPEGVATNKPDLDGQSYLGIEPITYSEKTGEPAFDKLVIERYRATLPAKSKQLRFIEALAERRACGTFMSYAEGYRRFGLPLEDVGADDYRIMYPSVNATGTDTLRCSSSNPNEQNISKRQGYNMRYCFGPKPGREWWSLDAKNLELRIPAYESGEAELIELFENPKEPPYYGSVHLLNFSTVYPDLWAKELKAVGIEHVGPASKKKYEVTWYRWCKNGGFAVQYGAVEREDGEGTADIAFHRPGSHALLKSRFSKLEKLNRKQIAYAEKYGWIETMPDSSVDPEHGYPLLCTRSHYGRILPTVPLNYHVQGTACWWMLMAMVRVQAYLDELNTDIPQKHLRDKGHFIIMNVHDELVFDFPKHGEANLPYIRHIADLMKVGGEHIGVPTPVDIEYNPRYWSEGTTHEH
jgi:DNA polymerase I-like protein with 3'-5' exonuclease and polymerase domains